jgi:Zn-dependent protease with chaperone function
MRVSYPRNSVAAVNHMGDINDLPTVIEEPSLQTGLAALQRKDYASAIATLKTVSETTPSPTTRARAQMGLVKALALTGEIEKAIAHCQPLSDHANEQIRSWAIQTLTELSALLSDESSSASNKPETNSDFTGFVPLDENAAQPRQVIRRSPSQSNASKLNPASPVQSSSSSQAQAKSQAKSQTQHRTPFQPSTRSQVTDSPELSASPEHPDRPIPTWKQAGRSAKWTNLGKVDFTQLWGVEALTVVGFIGMVWAIPWVTQGLMNWILWQFSWPLDLRRWAIFQADLRLPLTVLLIVFFAASPWLFKALLAKLYAAKPLKLSDLERHSPETGRLLKRICNQRQIPLPALGLLPDQTPLIFTYGHLPKTAHIIVSQGLLDQLSDDEIAALYAAELAHIVHWNFGIIAWIMLVAQLPYQAYWSIAAWGDRQHDRVLQSVAIAGSSLAYGLYRLLRLPGLGLSRMRHYYSDRTATEWTGNPNGLTRALIKVAMGLYQNIQQQGATSPLLESMDLLMPVGIGNALKNIPSGDITAWERSHPYRHWLAILDSHTGLGDRLHLLTLYAKHWRLDSELDWGNPANHLTNGGRTKVPFQRFLLQTAPFAGIVMGWAIALLLSIWGWVAYKINWLGWSWLWNDQSIFLGIPLIGFSLGMFWRINAFFPDIKHSNTQTDLWQLLSNPAALPVDSQPIKVQGHLLGRKGFNNRLHQDLLLQTELGLIRLHHTSQWGALGDLFPQPIRPKQLMSDRFANEPVTVTGWFRRGVSPWIDVETIQAKRGTTLRSQHPIWSTTIGAAAAVIGIYMLCKGGSF